VIYGIGTDIVRVARMQENIDKHGEQFAQRILTDSELHDYNNSVQPAHFLAKRFAAKEATAKAMGTGFSQGLSLRHIGVAHDELGKPILEFSGAANEFIHLNEIKNTHVSLADEKEYAVAFVTLSG